MSKLTLSVHPELEDENLQAKVNDADHVIKQFISDLLLENKALQAKIIKNEVKYQSKHNYLLAKIDELELELKNRPTQTVVIERD